MPYPLGSFIIFLSKNKDNVYMTNRFDDIISTNKRPASGRIHDWENLHLIHVLRTVRVLAMRLQNSKPRRRASIYVQAGRNEMANDQKRLGDQGTKTW